jgi:hypothetical protein
VAATTPLPPPSAIGEGCFLVTVAAGKPWGSTPIVSFADDNV